MLHWPRSGTFDVLLQTAFVGLRAADAIAVLVPAKEQAFVFEKHGTGDTSLLPAPAQRDAELGDDVGGGTFSLMPRPCRTVVPYTTPAAFDNTPHRQYCVAEAQIEDIIDFISSRGNAYHGNNSDRRRDLGAARCLG